MPITPPAALRAASRLARTDPDLIDARIELARRVQLECPGTSNAACRRAADQVIAGRRSGTPPRYKRTAPAVEPLAARLARFRRAAVARAYEACHFRQSRADTNRLVITFGEPDARDDRATGWIDYKSKGYKQGIVSQVTHIVVRTNWRVRTRDVGRVLDGGMLTLDAVPVADDGTIATYRATWARQGRGCDLVVEHGHIARDHRTGATYHSAHDDPRRAVTGLRRKLTLQATPAEVREARASARQERRARQLAKLVDQVSRHDYAAIEHVTITRRDSLRAGNCQPGTDAFIDRFLPGRDEATIGELAAAIGRVDLAHLAGVDLTLARQLAAACLVAIRRDKNARRALGGA
jgi:hypothetical protein